MFRAYELMQQARIRAKHSRGLGGSGGGDGGDTATQVASNCEFRNRTALVVD